jgi:hypothetical protein
MFLLAAMTYGARALFILRECLPGPYGNKLAAVREGE